MYAFSATNVAGVRATWYFDLKAQAKAAHGVASSLLYSGASGPSPSALTAISAPCCMVGDFVSDSVEFTGWLVGYN